MNIEQVYDQKLEKTSRYNRIDFVLVFIIAFLPRLYYNLQMLPVRTISDEVATMSTGAYFAGLDWSSVVSNAGYYGGGFSILLTPIFMLTDDPVIIYRVALIFSAFLQSLVAPISYHLMKKYFKLESRRMLLIISVCCSFMIVTRANFVFNEHMLILIVWLLAWVLCALCNCLNGKKKILYTLLLLLLLSYALTVHIRSAVLWIAVVIAVMCFFIKTRKWLVSRIVFAVGGVCGYFSANYFIKFIQGNIWLLGQGETIRNSTIDLTIKVSITDPTVWSAWLKTIVGQIYTIGYFSGTIMFFSIIIFVPVIFQWIFNINHDEKNSDDTYFVIAFVFMGCVAMTIVGQAITWLSSAVTALKGGNSYGFKAFTYIRYFAPYCGPVFMITLLYLIDNKENIISIIKKTLIFLLIIQTYWMYSIVPLLDGESSGSEFFVGLIGQIMGKYSDIYMYIVPMMIIIIIFLTLFFLSVKQKIHMAYILVFSFLLLEYNCGSYSWDIYNGEVAYNKVSAGYELIREIEDNDYVISDTLYVIDSLASDHRTFYLYQFYLNRYTIIPYAPDESCAEAIVFCNTGTNSQLLNQGYKVFQLDNNEWVYVIGDDYIQIIENVI
ncbi:MAG: hypothetical protein LUI87_04305 [Lachnospiraceae bacterium]|nr:hypothetical protein [Lachnospiraceae bacterium]